VLTRFKTLTVNRFTFITAVFYVCVFNIPLFDIIKKGIEKQPDVDPVFIASMPLFLIFALSFVFSLFTVKYLLKPFFIILTLLSSSVFFAALKYNIVFDYGMIENTFQTNSAEALMYVNFASILNMLLTGILPAYLIYKADIQYKPFFKELLHKVLFMLAMLAGLGIIAFFYFQDYASFGRNNDEIKRYIVPTYFIGAAAKYINVHYLQTPIKYEQLTATAVSLPCMFSRMGRDDYDSRRAYAQDTAVDVLNHGGIKVQWFDNDSGCKGVCDQVENITIDLKSDPELCSGQYCFDQVLLNKLDEALANAEQKDTVIALHIIGSHGPTYYLRYPPEHRKFTPDCPRSDIQNCSAEALMNTYDNTILYTDYILSQVVNKLKQHQEKFDTAMFYLSDHGESLGEKGMYLHGAPYSIAPIEQTSIPMLAWFSEDFSQDNHLNMACLAKEAEKGGFSHDNLFDSLLGLMNVQTQVYQPELDIFARCRG